MELNSPLGSWALCFPPPEAPSIQLYSRYSRTRIMPGISTLLKWSASSIIGSIKMKVYWMAWILAASLRCLWQSVAVKVMKVAFTAYSAGAITNGESAPILCSDFVIRSTAAARCRSRQQRNPASTLKSASEHMKEVFEEPAPRTGRPARTEGICR